MSTILVPVERPYATSYGSNLPPAPIPRYGGLLVQFWPPKEGASI